MRETEVHNPWCIFIMSYRSTPIQVNKNSYELKRRDGIKRKETRWGYDNLGKAYYGANHRGDVNVSSESIIQHHHPETTLYLRRNNFITWLLLFIGSADLHVQSTSTGQNYCRGGTKSARRPYHRESEYDCSRKQLSTLPGRKSHCQNPAKRVSRIVGKSV